MSKTTKIIVAVVVVLLVVLAIVLVVTSKNGESSETASKLEEVTSADGLVSLIDKIYQKSGIELLPSLTTETVDVSQTDTVKMLTGLDNGDNLEYLVVSQPMMSSQAYSVVLAKVKDGVKANEVAKTMSEQVDMRRWICVEAEKLYAVNSGDVVILIMADNDSAKAIYDSFKELAGGVGQEYEKSGSTDDLPADMY